MTVCGPSGSPNIIAPQTMVVGAIRNMSALTRATPCRRSTSQHSPYPPNVESTTSHTRLTQKGEALGGSACLGHQEDAVQPARFEGRPRRRVPARAGQELAFLPRALPGHEPVRSARPGSRCVHRTRSVEPRRQPPGVQLRQCARGAARPRASGACGGHRAQAMDVELVRARARAAGCRRPGDVAQDLMLVYEGAPEAQRVVDPDHVDVHLSVEGDQHPEVRPCQRPPLVDPARVVLGDDQLGVRRDRAVLREGDRGVPGPARLLEHPLMGAAPFAVDHLELELAHRGLGDQRSEKLPRKSR